MAEERDRTEEGKGVRNEVREGREGVLEDERCDARRVLARKVDSDGAADALAVKDHWGLRENGMFPDVIEGSLSIKLQAWKGRG